MFAVDDTKLEELSAPVSQTQPSWFYRDRNRNHNHRHSLFIIITITLSSTLVTIITNCVFEFANVRFLQAQPKQGHEPSILVPPHLLAPYQVHTSTKFGPYITCPPLYSEPAAMIAAGCSFDLLANGWVPNPCFDEPMHTEFTRDQDYGFFEDINGTRRVHQDSIMRGDVSRWPDGLFVTFHEHFEHCRYILNGSVRAVQPPFTGILDMFHDEDHLLHCMHVLKQRQEATKIETYVKAMFTVHRCYLSLT